MKPAAPTRSLMLTVHELSFLVGACELYEGRIGPHPVGDALRKRLAEVLAGIVLPEAAT